MLCRGLRRWRGNFNIVGHALDSKGALKEIAEHHPDAALINDALQDGPTAGFTVLRELRHSRSSTPVIMLLDGPEQEGVLRAFSYGAKGVVCRTERFEVVCKCIRRVHGGQIWASSGQLRLIIEAFAERGPLSVIDVKGRPLLTKREEEIVRMVAEGLTNRQIFSALRLSSHTVKNHLFRIYEKLGISNRVELVLYALSSSPRTSQRPNAAA
jgi:DNA-binding NarL/FixJ family response regulator